MHIQNQVFPQQIQVYKYRTMFFPSKYKYKYIEPGSYLANTSIHIQNHVLPLQIQVYIYRTMFFPSKYCTSIHTVYRTRFFPSKYKYTYIEPCSSQDNPMPQSQVLPQQIQVYVYRTRFFPSNYKYTYIESCSSQDNSMIQSQVLP